MRTWTEVTIGLASGLFLALGLFWLAGQAPVSADCTPDPECEGACTNVCVWDYAPQSTTAFGTNKDEFSEDMDFEWCLPCPVFFGYADFDDDHASNANIKLNPEPVAYPDFFYLNTCSGSVQINISGYLNSACTQPSRVVTVGEVADQVSGECESSKVLTINNAPGC